MQDQLKKGGAVLITGASRGLGLAFSYEFASHGFDLILTARDNAALDGAAADIKEKYGVGVSVYPADLSAPHAAYALYERIKKDGLAVSVLVNNAGIGACGESWNIDPKRETDMMNVNIGAATELSKLCAADFASERLGSILNVCSVGAFQPGPYTASYYAAKAYLYNYTLALRTELKGYGVGVTALCPGSIATDFFTSSGSRTPGGAASAEKVAAYAYKKFMQNKATVIYPFKNRLALPVPKRIRSAFIAKMKK